ncbi:MAG: Z1 domain-containing protein [Flaviflexus sp.]|uniref:Z1 domain-containing protein n=1 Tax=Flaviflexus sp. TaxID=1969482 RepID=UPI003F91F1C1
MADELTAEIMDEADEFYEMLCRRAGVIPDSGSVAARELSKVEEHYPGYKAWRTQQMAKTIGEIEELHYASRLLSQGVKRIWYHGPNKHQGVWPDYRKVVERSLPAKAVEDLDKSTNQILNGCANPRELGSKNKGLVVGYVQSGKTASFEGLIAKAVDAGYRIVIVLAGMHNNLRDQTQSRLNRDLKLGESGSAQLSWLTLTDEDNDFLPGAVNSSALNNRTNVAIAVVKKNSSVLKKLNGWLASIDEGTRRDLPILIVDDESDQATPNTRKRQKQISAINKRVRELWKTVKTGSYVAYTATPFANVFIDPNDSDDMYPDDFIFALPEPDGYMGASSFFNLEGDAERTSDADLALAIEVDDYDAQVLTPQPPNIEDYDPHITDSLGEAIRWFILATAIREIRQGENHSTMLVHTSHRIYAHDRLSDVIDAYVKHLWANRHGEEASFRQVFEDQAKRVSDFGTTWPDWHDVWARVINDVLPQIAVVVENGMSETRLSYDDSNQTVIVVGGATLSRGLTLEGLNTSYFLRTSAQYDTLLQMGRWFGFRNGYHDLVRVWVAPGLLEDYAHLSRVENDMRERIEIMEKEDRAPREMALPILADTGRLKITGSNRMVAVREAQVGLSGSRRQTVYLARNPQRIAESQRAARDLVTRALEHTDGKWLKDSGVRPSLLLQNLPSSDLIQFLESYWVSKADTWLQPKKLNEWVTKYSRKLNWNLVLVSGPESGCPSFDFGHGVEVGTVVRTPLKKGYWSPKRMPDELPHKADIVNIRALVSGSHQVLDLKILDENGQLPPEHSVELRSKNASRKADARLLRKEILSGQGLILIYVIDKDSRPLHDAKTRMAMEADDHLIGLTVIFPEVANEDPRTFYSVEIEHDADMLSEEELAQQFEMADEDAFLDAALEESEEDE